MTRVAIRRATFAAALVAVLSAGALGGPAAAEEPAATGWWWAGRPSAAVPSAFTPVPAPPEGGLYVAGSPAGPWGMSALRFDVDTGATASTLTLRVSEASGTPSIVACRPTAAWEPVENGGWDERPEADCEGGSVAGVFNPDGSAVTFEVSLLQAGRVVDVLLLPAEDAGGSFAVAFEPPGDALAVRQPTPFVPPARRTDRVEPPRREPAPVPDLPDSFVVPVTPTAPPAQVADDPAPPARPVPTPDRPATVTGGLASVDGGFAYPAVLALPLALLVAGTYFAWALNQPVVVRLRPR